MSWPQSVAGGIAGSSSTVGSTTWANRPAAADNSSLVRITDVGGGPAGTGGGTLMYSNGTRWKPVNGAVLLDGIDTANVGAANTTEQQLNPNHVVIPAGVVGNFDKLRVMLTVSKSAGVDSATIRLRFGPLGTVADPAIATITALAGAQQTFATIMQFRRASATSIQRLGNADSASSYQGASAGAYQAAVAVSSMDANPMYMTFSVQMTGGTETPTLQDYTLELLPTESA